MQQRPVPLHSDPPKMLPSVPDLLPPVELIPGIGPRGWRQFVLRNEGGPIPQRSVLGLRSLQRGRYLM